MKCTSAASPGQRVAPIEAAEPSKIVVRGANPGTVLNGQCSNISVRCEIPCRPQRRNQSCRLQVTRGRFGHCDRGRLLPGIDQVEGLVHCERLLKQPCSRGQSQKSQEYDPGQSHSFRSRKRG